MALIYNFGRLDQSLSARGGVLVIPFIPQPNQVAVNYCTFGDAVTFGSVTGGQIDLRFPVQGPKTGKITQVIALIDPADGHVALPGVSGGGVPVLQLFGYDVGGALTVNLSQADTSATAGAYDGVHAITLNVPVDKGFFSSTAFHVRFVSESGTNSIVGLALKRLYLVVIPETSP